MRVLARARVPRGNRAAERRAIRSADLTIAASCFVPADLHILVTDTFDSPRRLGAYWGQCARYQRHREAIGAGQRRAAYERRSVVLDVGDLLLALPYRRRGPWGSRERLSARENGGPQSWWSVSIAVLSNHEPS